MFILCWVGWEKQLGIKAVACTSLQVKPCCERACRKELDPNERGRGGRGRKESSTKSRIFVGYLGPSYGSQGARLNPTPQLRFSSNSRPSYKTCYCILNQTLNGIQPLQSDTHCLGLPVPRSLKYQKLWKLRGLKAIALGTWAVQADARSLVLENCHVGPTPAETNTFFKHPEA